MQSTLLLLAVVLGLLAGTFAFAPFATRVQVRTSALLLTNVSRQLVLTPSPVLLFSSTGSGVEDGCQGW